MIFEAVSNPVTRHNDREERRNSTVLVFPCSEKRKIIKVISFRIRRSNSGTNGIMAVRAMKKRHCDSPVPETIRIMSTITRIPMQVKNNTFRGFLNL